MKRSAAWCAVVGLFVVGVLIGGLGTHLYYSYSYSHSPRPPGGPPGWGPPPPFGDRLERQLGLSPEQKRRIESILEQSRRETDEMRRELGPRLREHLERTRERIERELTPEQRERFRRMRDRHRRRAERFMLGHPH